MKEHERKPYNPYHLAGGYAAESLPDKKTAAVFARLCNHTDFMGGGITISVETIAKETRYSPRAVVYAIKVLKALGRISRKQRAIGGQPGGRKSCITTVHCTETELRAAGASEENYFGRGGSHGLIKTQSPVVRTAIPPEVGKTDDGSTSVGQLGLGDLIKTQSEHNQNAKQEESKRKTGGIKTHPVALEPLSTEPFLPELIKAEPLKAEKPTAKASSLPKEGKKDKAAAVATLLPPKKTGEMDAAAAGVLSPKKVAVEVISMNPSPLKTAVAAKLRDAGCPASVFAALAGYTKIVTILNGDTAGGCTNPITAYATFAKNNPNFAKLWMPVPNGKTTGTDADFDDGFSAADREDLRRMYANETDEERERVRAENWWGNLEIKQRHVLIEYEGSHPTSAQILAAYRAAMEAKSAVALGA